MHPVLLKIGFFEIYSYGFILAIAFLVCGFLASRRARQFDLGQEIVWDLFFWILLGGIAGARILYIFLNFNFFLRNPAEVFMVWHGGLVWYGGFLGGVLFGIFYLRKNKLDNPAVLDFIAPYIALGQAIGRIGCFLNGCCYGKPGIPAQFIASFLSFMIFIYLLKKQRKPHVKGNIFILYLILYSLKRFFVEFGRGDSAQIFFGLTIFQLISLGLFILAFGLWLRRRSVE